MHWAMRYQRKSQKDYFLKLFNVKGFKCPNIRYK